MQTKLIREGRLCAEDFPKAEFQTPARCLNPLPAAVLVFIFPLPRKKKWGEKRLFISKGIGTHPSKENTEKERKKDIV